MSWQDVSTYIGPGPPSRMLLAAVSALEGWLLGTAITAT